MVYLVQHDRYCDAQTQRKESSRGYLFENRETNKSEKEKKILIRFGFGRT